MTTVSDKVRKRVCVRPTAEYECFHCRVTFIRVVSQVAATQRKGRNIYCSRDCHTAQRRAGRTQEQLKECKRQREKNWREKHKSQVRLRSMAHYKKTTTSEKRQRLYQKYKHKIAARNKDPAAKIQKKHDDRIWRAKRGYGDYWESQVLLLKLNEELSSQTGEK